MKRVAWMLAISLGVTGWAVSSGPVVRRVELRGAITPPLSAHLQEAIRHAENEKAVALLIEMDTPGGLLDSTREMVQAMLSTPLPVIMYVSPAGARATSAGVFLTMASDVAAMAPDTHIGAAHPVSLGGETRRSKRTFPFDIRADSTTARSPEPKDESVSVNEEKAVSDAAAYIRALAKEKGRNAEWAEKAVRDSVSLTAEEARAQKVIEFIAADRADLFRQLDGKTLIKSGQKITLRFTGVMVTDHPLSAIRKILQTIANPSLAYLFMILGIYGLIYEFSSPGVGFGAIVGVTSLLLAAYSLSILPFNYVGILLMGLGVLLLILEIKIVSHGLLTVGGLLLLALGSLFLFDRGDPALRIPLEMIGGTVLVTGAFFVFAVGKIMKARKLAPSTGQEALIGKVAEVRESLSPQGMVFVNGELWKAHSATRDTIPVGASVRIVGVSGLILTVEKT